MEAAQPRSGVLLLQVGSPASPSVRDVRRYLREFLGDARVLDLPAPARWLLLHAVILPFRPRRSAAAYAKIWTAEGSPLRVGSERLARALAARLGGRVPVEVAMRYGEPTLRAAVDRLLAAGAGRIVALPLFPQTASSTTGSALEALHRELARRWNVPPVTTLGPFFDEPAFLDAWAARLRESLDGFEADHLLLSFHGLPERHVRRADPSGRCLASPDCCEKPGERLATCYRAQCFATARGIVARLGWPAERWSLSFQSRLGRTPWLRPYTDRMLPELAAHGVRRLAVACPAFVTDCLETLEEIGLRAREQWERLGGQAFLLVPSLNDHPAWVDALATLLRPHLAEGSG